MINSNETQMPSFPLNGYINSNETIPPYNTDDSDCSAILLSGESIADSYIIHSLLERQGKQSNVYLAKKWGKTYVIKVYLNGWQPSDKMKCFLTNVKHPNIATVIENGVQNGRYYEIYEYYSEGTLEDVKALSSHQIQNVVVPSINEGLFELHRNGIVHCDIKPSNLFFADHGTRIVIGDCGISGYVNSSGKLIDSVRGTPEYAPRVKALLWSAAMSPAYDYGSFGLVLCKAVLGYSLFSGMSIEEISQAWERGIVFPSQISGRIGTLIRGLLNEDEEQRWGYSDIKRWCEGEYLRPKTRSIYSGTSRKQAIKPLIFGRFEGQTLSVTTFHQLELAIKDHWEQATKIIKRRELLDFVGQYDKTLVSKVREIMNESNVDSAVFKLLMYIGDDLNKIVYCGKEYQSLSELIDQLSNGNDETAKKFIMSGMLVFYLRLKNADSAQVDKIEQIIQRNEFNDTVSIATICYALQEKKALDIFGFEVHNLDELINAISSHSTEEIARLIESNNFIAWMNRLGLEKEMRKMREL